MDFHAVFEAQDLDGRWYAYDATDLAPRQSMVRIVTGRDAADAAFASVNSGIATLGCVAVTATTGRGPSGRRSVAAGRAGLGATVCPPGSAMARRWRRAFAAPVLCTFWAWLRRSSTSHPIHHRGTRHQPGPTPGPHAPGSGGGPVSTPRSNSVRTMVAGRELTLSNLDKVMYPESGFTKGQLIEYYSLIAPVMLPHLKDRPLTMKRYPDGVEGQSFFEKHVPERMPPNGCGTSRCRPPTRDGRRLHRDLRPPRPGLGGQPGHHRVPCPALAESDGGASFPAPRITWSSISTRERARPSSSAARWRGPSPTCWTTRNLESLRQDERVQGPPALRAGRNRSTWERVREDARQIATALERDRPGPGRVQHAQEPAGQQGAHRLEPEPPGQDDGCRLLAAGPPRPDGSTPVTWEEVGRCAAEADAGLLRFTAADVLARVEELGDLFAPLGPEA